MTPPIPPSPVNKIKCLTPPGIVHLHVLTVLAKQYFELNYGCHNNFTNKNGILRGTW